MLRKYLATPMTRRDWLRQTLYLPMLIVVVVGVAYQLQTGNALAADWKDWQQVAPPWQRDLSYVAVHVVMWTGFAGVALNAWHSVRQYRNWRRERQSGPPAAVAELAE